MEKATQVNLSAILKADDLVVGIDDGKKFTVGLGSFVVLMA
jgi:hypothetical protein